MFAQIITRTHFGVRHSLIGVRYSKLKGIRVIRGIN